MAARIVIFAADKKNTFKSLTSPRLKKIRIGTLYLLLLALWSIKVASADLPDTIEKIKPSVVGVGIYNRLTFPSSKLLGAGFVVGSGQLVATNAHVISTPLNKQKKDKLVVFIGHGSKAEVRNVTVLAVDKTRDLALLKISGQPLLPLSLTERRVREGETVAFTGFPIGAALGLNPVTHRGIISSITPITTPAKSTKNLSSKKLKSLKNSYDIYQLDATAYPGNSGSPVYDPNTGEVVAVINKVLVKSTKEHMLSDPSAITYAIPIKYLNRLINSLN